jgi:hypothetical protein
MIEMRLRCDHSTTCFKGDEDRSVKAPASWNALSTPRGSHVWQGLWFSKPRRRNERGEGSAFGYRQIVAQPRIITLHQPMS